jgi:hypothetical protein
LIQPTLQRIIEVSVNNESVFDCTHFITVAPSKRPARVRFDQTAISIEPKSTTVVVAHLENEANQRIKAKIDKLSLEQSKAIFLTPPSFTNLSNGDIQVTLIAHDQPQASSERIQFEFRVSVPGERRLLAIQRRMDVRVDYKLDRIGFDTGPPNRVHMGREAQVLLIFFVNSFIFFSFI